MFAALSATNEAIMRAKSRAELFELVCEAAANGGKFTSTSIALVDPESDVFGVMAVAGPRAETTRRLKASLSDARPEGHGHQWDCVPVPPGLHQQRLSVGPAMQRLPRRRSQRRREIRRGIPVVRR